MIIYHGSEKIIESPIWGKEIFVMIMAEVFIVRKMKNLRRNGRVLIIKMAL